MPLSRVSVAESAVVDLKAILDWYADQSEPEVGKRLVGRVLDRLGQLEQFPESGRVVPEFGQQLLRELIEPPFRIVYRCDVERVRVIRVWRSERLLAGEEIQSETAAAPRAQTGSEE